MLSNTQFNQRTHFLPCLDFDCLRFDQDIGTESLEAAIALSRSKVDHGNNPKQFQMGVPLVLPEQQSAER